MESLIYGFIGFISFVTFLMIAWNIGTIVGELKKMNQVLSAWSRETGIGLITKCKKCKRGIHGKLEKCPHCGEPTEFK